MSLADRAKKGAPPSRAGLPCSIALLLTALPEGERNGLTAMFGDREWTQRAIHEAIKAEGYDVPWTAVGHHRRQTCRCFR